MNLWKKVFIIATLTVGLLVIAIPIGIFAYIKLTLYSLEKDTSHYLLVDKGLQKTSIMSIKPVFGKAPSFSVKVVFKDEPDNVYYYKKDEGQVVQYSHASFKSDTNNKYKYVEK